jgi:hypothetical protein
MRRLPLLLGLLLLGGADYPPANSLPARAELPDPLVTFGGKKVATPEEWSRSRRPELKGLFQHYMYGLLPAAPKLLRGEVLHEDSRALGGKATLREIALSVGEKAPRIYLLLITPNSRKGPVPTFVGINFCGNHAVVADPKIHIPEGWIYGGPGVKDNRATEAGRGKQAAVWNPEMIVERGYALATFYNGDVDPDRADRRDGLRPWLASPETGSVMAWAWGAHRAVDYLVGLPEIDPKKVMVVGHSRLGKAALVAAAFDERIALCIPHQAGCGGTAPSRCHNPKAETIKRINAVFPHWFDAEFKKFSDDPDRLPFDQNCLAALVAPRPLLFSNATEDQWANPEGQFQVLQAADPVYRLLGAGGLEAKEMPPVGELSGGTLGYFIRPGKHSMSTEDWKAFLDFADRQLGKKGK